MNSANRFVLGRLDSKLLTYTLLGGVFLAVSSLAVSTAGAASPEATGSSPVEQPVMSSTVPPVVPTPPALTEPTMPNVAAAPAPTNPSVPAVPAIPAVAVPSAESKPADGAPVSASPDTVSSNAAEPIATSEAKASEAKTAEASKPADAASSAEQTAVAAPSREEILRMLRNPGATPLTVAQLAALNDALKRMDYLSEIEQKMTQMGLDAGVSTSVTPSATSTSPSLPHGPSGVSPEMPGGGLPPGMPSGLPGGIMPDQSVGSVPNYSVVRVIGMRGAYSALLSTGSSQLQVHVGDNITGGRIASIDLSGVRLSTSNGIVALPFSAPAIMGGVSVGGFR